MSAPADCEKCPRLVESREMVVNGSGPQPADVMIIAQNPGAKEEQVGYPLYEQAYSGKVLRTKLMTRAGIDPATVRFENIVRCRPPKKPDGSGDYPPKPIEVKACRDFLLEEIQATRPKIIITLGDPALRWFFPDLRLYQCHGRAQLWCPDTDNPNKHTDIMVIPMYHPAAAAPGRDASLVQVMQRDWDLLADTTVPALGTYRLVSGEFMYNLIKGVDHFAFDFETTDPSWRGTFQARRARPIGYSVAIRGGAAFYTEDSISHIRGGLEDPNVGVYAHNAKFEWIICKNEGIDIQNLHCTKVMAWLLRYKSSALKDLSWVILKRNQTRFEDVKEIIDRVIAGTASPQDVQDLVDYAAADSDFTLQIAPVLEAQLKKDGLWSLYNDIERPLTPKIGAMEMAGISLDSDPLSILQWTLDTELTVAHEWLDEQFPSDPPINWASGKQVARILHGPDRITVEATGELKGRKVKEDTVRAGAQVRIRYWPPGLDLPVAAWTDTTHQPKTDMNTLRQYQHPVPEKLVWVSSAETVISRELIPLPNLVQEDGRIHASFHQAGDWEERGGPSDEAPKTGRLSCSGPALHGLTHHGDDERPYMADWGYRIHSAFTATDDDHELVKVDIGQEEPRIGAFLSGCESLLDELMNGDVYLKVASRIYGYKVTKAEVEKRQIGKRSFMAWLNRAGAAGIQRSAFWLPDDKGWGLINWLRKEYFEVEDWWGGLKKHIRKHGYVETYFKRRIYRPEVYTGNAKQVAGVDRAIAPDAIQGTAADVLKIGWGRLVLPDGAVAVMNRHDELLFDVHKDVLQTVIEVCANLTKDILPIILPAEVSHGPNWADQTRVI